MNEQPPIFKPITMSELASPCVRNCCLDEADICMGCGRSLAEIVGWTKADNTGKAQILERAKARRLERRRAYGPDSR